MNGWGWAALSCAGLILLAALGSAVGRLFVVDPYPQDQDEMQNYSAIKQALGGGNDLGPSGHGHHTHPLVGGPR